MTLNPYIEAHELRELVLKKEVRPREVAEFFLARVEKLNPRLGAFMTVTADRALADASRLEKMIASDAAALPLFGVAYSLKDLVWTRDIRTTFGSRNYENWHAPADAELAVRLANSGGILLGKTTTPEFGLRPTTEGGLCPPARNPWNLEHTAGGSSGGAGCAVAAGLHPVAQGSDGGGSIRIPAACCGVVGIKPSRGRITRAPQEGEAWAGLSTTGPIARTVRDAALMLDAMAGMMPGIRMRRGRRCVHSSRKFRPIQKNFGSASSTIARSARWTLKLLPRWSPHAPCCARWAIASSR